MKTLILVAMMVLGFKANAASIELGAGDYYTYKYTGEQYTSMLVASAEGYQNMFLVGRGMNMDGFYLGVVAGVSLKDDVNKSGLGLTAGAEASFKVDLQDGYSVKLEAIQTPFMDMQTVLFSYSF